jgi:hypothetical protein
MRLVGTLAGQDEAVPHDPVALFAAHRLSLVRLVVLLVDDLGTAEDDAPAPQCSRVLCGSGRPGRSADEWPRAEVVLDAAALTAPGAANDCRPMRRVTAARMRAAAWTGRLSTPQDSAGWRPPSGTAGQHVPSAVPCPLREPSSFREDLRVELRISRDPRRRGQLRARRCGVEPVRCQGVAGTPDSCSVPGSLPPMSSRNGG